MKWEVHWKELPQPRGEMLAPVQVYKGVRARAEGEDKKLSQG